MAYYKHFIYVKKFWAKFGYSCHSDASQKLRLCNNRTLLCPSMFDDFNSDFPFFLKNF